MAKLKRIGVLLLLCVLVFSMSVSAVGADSYSGSFTHRETIGGRKTVYMPDMYTPVDVVSAYDLGIEEGFDEIKDIECDIDGNIYLLIKMGRVVVFDQALQFSREIVVTTADGEPVDYEGAQGIFLMEDGQIYIADTENARVLRCDNNGVVLQEIGMAETDLVPSDFMFRPTKVTVDSKGYLYVLSDGSYYGAVLYDPEGKFVSFYGANTVKASVLTTLANLWDMLVQNDVKRAKTERVLPFQFIDIVVDKDDFVYTCTGRTGSGASGQLRMLSPGGSNILYKKLWQGGRQASDSYNFGESSSFNRAKKAIYQNFVSLQVDERGYVYLLDAAYGLIYIYDTECNLLTVFGGGYGKGDQAGVFHTPTSMTLYGDRLFVSDGHRNSVTVFELTEFGKTFMNAQSLTLKSDHLTAKPLWNQVLSADAGNQLAQRALAKTAFIEGDYDLALSLSKVGLDAATYAQALGKVQERFTSQNFLWIFPLALVLIGAIVAWMIISRKRSVAVVKNEKVQVLFSAPFHPFLAFQKIKFQKQGSMPIALIITAFFFLSGALQTTASDFRFTSYDPTTYNIIFQFLRTVGLIVLWSLANWGVSTLQEGKGRLKEIFIVSAYSMVPVVLYQFISIPISHLLTSTDSLILTGLETVALILAGVMLIVGLMTIHDMTFPRFLFTAVLTVLGMLLVVFIIFMIGMLLSQFWQFIVTIFMEVAYR